jgi:ankyrin repeat protein
MPHHSAASAGHFRALDLLLFRGAPVGAPNGRGRQALHLAAAGGHVHAIRVALKHGAGISSANSKGWQAVRRAAARAGAGGGRQRAAVGKARLGPGRSL